MTRHAVVARTSSPTTKPTDPSAARVWHDSSVLIAELATLNRRIACYIAQMLDADAQRRPAVDVAEQAGLGWQLIELGQLLRDRAEVAAVVDSEVTQSGYPAQGSTDLPVRRSPCQASGSVNQVEGR